MDAMSVRRSVPHTARLPAAQRADRPLRKSVRSCDPPRPSRGGFAGLPCRLLFARLLASSFGCYGLSMRRPSHWPKLTRGQPGPRVVGVVPTSTL